MTDLKNLASQMRKLVLENKSKPKKPEKDFKSAYEMKLLKQQIDASINDLIVPFESIKDTAAITKLLKCINRIELLLKNSKSCGGPSLQTEVLSRLVGMMSFGSQRMEFQSLFDLKTFFNEMLIYSIAQKDTSLDTSLESEVL